MNRMNMNLALYGTGFYGSEALNGLLRDDIQRSKKCLAVLSPEELETLRQAVTDLLGLLGGPALCKQDLVAGLQRMLQED